MCNELSQLADQSGFDVGAYRLKMASLEFAKHLAPADRRPGTRRPDAVIIHNVAVHVIKRQPLFR